MKRQVVILPAAEDDLNAGHQFYEEQEEELGSYFADTLASEIESLLVHGGVHRKLHGFHRCLSKRFPFAIFYRLEVDTIFIYAVLNCRRDPAELWVTLRGR